MSRRRGRARVLQAVIGADLLSAVHRNGQTFLTFLKSDFGTAPYSVYRETSPITSVAGLTPIATLDANSAQNLYTGTGLVIHDLASPLNNSTTALLVWTTAVTGSYYYAVTSGSVPGVILGDNSYGTPINETALTVPGAVLIDVTPNNGGTDMTRYRYYWYDRFEGWRASAWGPHWHRFDVYVPESAWGLSPPYLAHVRLHAAGTCTWAEPSFASTPAGVVVVPMDLCTQAHSGGDPYVSGGYFHSKWFGRLDSVDGVYRNITEARVVKIAKWVRDQSTFQINPNRVYIAGSSLGSGAMYIAAHNPGVFAGSKVSVGWINDNAWSPLPNASTTRVNDAASGPFLSDYLDMAHQATLGPFTPCVHTFNKDDGTISATDYPATLTTFETNRQPYAAQWQNGNHTEFGMEVDYNQWDFLRFTKDEAYPCFGSASNSSTVSASPNGERNGNLDWHGALHSITGGSAIQDDTSTFAISLISLSGSATATVTIRNMQNFLPTPSQSVSWSNSGGGSGSVNANSDGSVTITGLTIPTSATRLTLTK